MNNQEKIAYALTVEKIKTKDDFLDFLVESIKVIHFIFENGNSIVASDEDDTDVIFLQLKEKIAEWAKESTHSQPFYPRKFIKRILKTGVLMEYVKRLDNPDKMRPEYYGLENENSMKQFILSRIDNEDERQGLKFKPNSMVLSRNGMPLDIYNAIVYNYNLLKETRLYIKFEVNKNFSEAFFRMKFISTHDDEVQQ